jgi:predicted aldo/keto reductase-like oxidoreductase
MKKSRSKRPFYVATKSSKPTPEGVRQDLETSLKRMNLDCIDFYHVWCIINPGSYEKRKLGGAIREFEKLKREGLIKHICVSSHMTGEEIETMLNDYPFEGLLVGYSAMNFAYRERALDAAVKINAGVVVMNPLGGGIIPQNPDRFSFIKTQENETIVEGALRFLLNDSRITTTLVGLSSIQEVNEAVSAMDGFKPIGQDKVNIMRDHLKNAFNELCTGCRYCDKCPAKVPVPKLMDAYNHTMLRGKEQAAIDRLQWHWGITPTDPILHECTECGICEEACTQKLPIRDRIKAIQKAAISI